jgi:hypothetical protein
MPRFARGDSGVDYSEERISYANEHYASDPTVSFIARDLRDPLRDLGP